MKKNTPSTSFELNMVVDKPVIAKNQECIRILEINLTSASNAITDERAPLNLSLVLDRSGSMDGEKLHYVKQAAAHVTDLMGDSDHLSIITYDNEVDNIFPSDLMTDANKALAKSKIQNIHSGNSTFLSGGWLKGCEEVAKGATNKTINRTLLLTDGLANVGIQDIDELSTHSRELYKRGVSTSSFGVGSGYNEHILERMANSGGGNFHFLETMNAIPLVFEREFAELMQISLRDVEINLQLSPTTKAEVLAGWQSDFEDNQVKIQAGSLYSERKLSIYLKLIFNEISDYEEIFIPVLARGRGIDDAVIEVKQEIKFKLVSDEDEIRSEQDRSLMERFALIDMADKVNEALRRERAGNRIGASHLVRSSLDEHEQNMSASMKQKFGYLANEMSMGLSEASRKSHHREEYDNKRGRNVIRDYYLELVNCHLIAKIGDERVLIDTGIPISLGSPSEWYFMNEVHHLSADYMGVTTGYITNMVGTHVDVLMGCDILKKFFVIVNIPHHEIHFSLREYHEGRDTVPMKTFMGVPIVACEIDGSDHEMYLDTGAKLSYVSQKIASQFTPIGEETDFYPGIGEFRTSVFEVPMRIGTITRTIRCGVLPPLLEMSMLISGKTGIIGSELFRVQAITLAFPQNLAIFH